MLVELLISMKEITPLQEKRFGNSINIEIYKSYIFGRNLRL
jgi:hypothetical protein